MNKETKERIKSAYQLHDKLPDALREAEVARSTYHHALLKDRNFYREMAEIRESKNPKSREVKIAIENAPELKAKIIKTYPDVKFLVETLRILGITQYCYERLKEDDKEFKKIMLNLIKEMRLGRDPSEAKNVDFKVESYGWTPPNQGLIEYDRTHNSL